MSRTFQFRLFLVSVIFHIYFYISARFTHTLEIFYSNINVGQDFFQIPNAVYAFLHNGTLTGIIPSAFEPYINCCGVNANVYHPLFTLLIGYPLQLFRPWDAFTIWTWIHVLITALLVYFLWSKFRNHRYLYLALSLFLLNSYHYYEIWHAQYHFLFNFFTILFLYESVKHGDTKKAGMWLFFSLLVKPIGLLWILPLLLYQRYTTVILGFGSFFVITALFNYFPFGSYYLHNFFTVSTSTMIGANNIYGIQILIPSVPIVLIKLLRTSIFLGLLIFQVLKKPKLYTIISLWICFQLLFYPLVYLYQVTILAGVFCLGILLDVFPPKKLLLIPIIFLTLPTIVVFYHLAGIWELGKIRLTIAWLYTVFLLFWFSIALFINGLRGSAEKLGNRTNTV